MQFVSIFFPILDVYKNRSAKNSFSETTTLDVTPYDQDGNINSLPGSRSRDIYSMASLEMQISKNLDPLLRWAAEKEFTAENIVFLRAVRDFKRKWTNITKRTPTLGPLQEREKFEDGAYIWFKLVNPLTAQFNINIDYRTYSELEQMFSGLRYEPYDDDEASSKKSSIRSENVVAPWMEAEKEPVPRALSPTRTSTSDEKVVIPSDIDKLYQFPVTEISIRADVSDDEKAGNVDPSSLVPANFSLEVFDKAYETVKNDVFLNTWVRYEARFSRPHDPNATPLRESLYAKVIKPPSVFKRATNRLFGLGRRNNDN
jgi:hypothetical protein